MSIHTLRKRFTRDQNLPIQVLQSPYFEYFIDLYEGLYQSRTKYEGLLTEVEELGGEEAYLQHYSDTKNTILQHVQNKVSYQTFNGDKLLSFESKSHLPKAKLYHESNHGEHFVSIDLEKANFHALRYYDADILDGKPTYQSWIEGFTSLSSLHDSKYLRQVLFGNLNPKKQQKIQQYITHSFLEQLVKFVNKDDILSASHDEIILRQANGVSIQEIKETLEELYQGAFPLHVDSFVLEKNTPCPEFGFVKRYVNSDKLEFKGIPSHFMAQAYQTFNGKPFKQEDLLFFYEGQIAQFMTPLFQQKAD